MALIGTGTTGGGAGGSPFTVVRFPFAWNTPNIVSPSGVVIYTPAVGDIISASYLSIPSATPFNGSLPSLWLYSQDNPDPFNAGFVAGPFVTTNTPLEQGQTEGMLGNLLSFGQPVTFVTTTPLVASLRKDDDGGDPGSTAGAGELILVIIPAT